MSDREIHSVIRHQIEMYDGMVNRYLEKGLGSEGDGNEKRSRILGEGRFTVDTDSTFSEAPADWIWKDWIQKGCVTILTGAPGEGKSNIVAYLAARISVGGTMPDGETCRQGNTIIWSSEDAGATIRARCVANGGNLANINIIAGSSNGLIAHMFVSEEDRLDFFRLIMKLPRPELIVIDNIMNIMCGKDPNNNIAVRSVLAPFLNLAERYNIAVLLVAHTGKSTSRRSLAYSTLGSIAFSGVARTQLNIAKRAGSNEGIIVRAMSNITASNGGYPFQLVPTTVGEQNVQAIRVDWGEAVEGVPAELIADYTGASTDMRTELDAWLTGRLEEGPVPSTQIYREANSLGFSRTAVKMAKQRLNIQHTFQRGRHARGGSISLWYLPEVSR